MRIGIYAQAPSANGGVFRYTMTFLDMLQGLDLEDEFVVLHRRSTDVPIHALVGKRWSDAVLPTRLTDLVRELGVGLVGEERARWLWYQATRLWPGSIVVQPASEARFDRRGA